MDTVVASKHLIIEQINSIIGFVQEDNKVKSNEIENLYSKIKKLNSDNKTLHNELMEKEKQIAISEKKMIDYEVMINHIQDKANEEIEEKEKFSMLRAKDKEIHQLNMIVQKMETEITHLKQMNESSQSKCDKNIEMDIKSKSVCGFSPTSSPLPVYTKPESLDLNEETPVEETQVEETPVEETPVEETQVEETPVEEKRLQWKRLQWKRLQWKRSQWKRLQWKRLQWKRLQWKRLQWKRLQWKKNQMMMELRFKL